MSPGNSPYLVPYQESHRTADSLERRRLPTTTCPNINRRSISSLSSSQGFSHKGAVWEEFKSRLSRDFSTVFHVNKVKEGILSCCLHESYLAKLACYLQYGLSL